ncbi:MAG: 3-hydroxybutyryl-CoA dehydrogenase, partial [Leptolyngbya sp. SIO4C5]|nr:3-hydroxybutyryl-CoA dehydrogenase [Leptolyngbya sp. SIO4C5]
MLCSSGSKGDRGYRLNPSVSLATLAAGDADAALARITPTADNADLSDCDLVIEAATENK